MVTNYTLGEPQAWLYHLVTLADWLSLAAEDFQDVMRMFDDEYARWIGRKLLSHAGEAHEQVATA